MHGQTAIKNAEEISAVLPAYNEEGNVERTVMEVLGALERLAGSFEVIVVDDGSTDRTGEIADSLSSRDPRVRVVHHPGNRGYGAALNSGFEAARLDWIFFTDADGQFDMDDLSVLVELAAENDMVVGYRANRMDPWHRRLYGRMFSALMRTLFGIEARDVNCAFKLFKRGLIPAHGLMASGALINAELLAEAARRGVTPAQAPVTHLARKWGKPTGGSSRVIARAASETVSLWLRMRKKRAG